MGDATDGRGVSRMLSRARDRKELLAEILEQVRPTSMLDVGCGTGELALRLVEIAGVEECVGVDVSAAAVERAEEHGLTAYQVDVEDERLPFEDDRFDVITASEVIDYLCDPGNLFREVQRCLRPGGVFVLTTPNLASSHNRIALLAGRLPLPMQGQFDRLADGDERATPLSKRCSLYTCGVLHTVLEEHGFVVTEVLGASGERPDSSLLHAFVETLAVQWPPLSYRNVFVCEHPP
ncbi:class I SAM-dependent methyltransferase [Haloglomus litoreum]|uniref:class I SAM-dependent methyltransferase n=1 Tax=Haloglomus litoreum TaxID=3034026 RepID=UPI0023E7776B|nr:class I SAM-dependent methyltransferase [Haloglomus sp. DT116]